MQIIFFSENLLFYFAKFSILCKKWDYVFNQINSKYESYSTWISTWNLNLIIFI